MKKKVLKSTERQKTAIAVAFKLLKNVGARDSRHLNERKETIRTESSCFYFNSKTMTYIYQSNRTLQFMQSRNQGSELSRPFSVKTFLEETK